MGSASVGFLLPFAIEGYFVKYISSFLIGLLDHAYWALYLTGMSVNFFGSFRGTAKKSTLHDVFNKCCVRKCTKIIFIIFIFLNSCLTKQQFLFVALFRFLLTLNIKKIIIINYNLNRPIKLRKQNTAILIVLREN